MNQQGQVKHTYLKAKYQIGSCKGAMDFEMNEHVFPPLDKKLRKRHEEIKLFKRYSKNSPSKLPWDDSKGYSEFNCERRSSENVYFDLTERPVAGGFDYRSTELPYTATSFSDRSLYLKRRKFDPLISRGSSRGREGQRRMHETGEVSSFSLSYSDNPFFQTTSLFMDSKDTGRGSQHHHQYREEDDEVRCIVDNQIQQLYTKGPFRPFSQRKHRSRSSSSPSPSSSQPQSSSTPTSMAMTMTMFKDNMEGTSPPPMSPSYFSSSLSPRPSPITISRHQGSSSGSRNDHGSWDTSIYLDRKMVSMKEKLELERAKQNSRQWSRKLEKKKRREKMKQRKQKGHA